MSYFEKNNMLHIKGLIFFLMNHSFKKTHYKTVRDFFQEENKYFLRVHLLEKRHTK